MPSGKILADHNALDGPVLPDYNSLVHYLLSEKLPEIFNIQGNNRSLEISNLELETPNKYPDLKAQLEAKHANIDYSVPIWGTFTLKDKSGKKLAENRRIIMRLPFPTGRGTFIFNGKEYGIRKQLRLRPGVYTTKVEDGVQTFINTSTRQNLKIRFNPDDSVFELGVANRKFPLGAVLQALGVSPSEMRSAWGESIYRANIFSPEKIVGVVDRLYDTMYAYGDKDLPTEQKAEEVRRALTESAVDPWQTGVTLGTKYNFITPDMLVKSTKRILDVSAGGEEDNRDALYFKVPFGINDMVKFALDKNSRTIARKLANRVDDVNKDLDSVLSRPLTAVNNTIRTRFSASELSFIPDQLNPLDILSSMSEITFMGEGGLSSGFTITESSRKLNDSYVGFIDPMDTPKSDKLGADLQLAYSAAKRGDKLVRIMLDKTGKDVVVSPQDLYNKYVAMPGQGYIDPSTKKFKSIHPTITAIHKGKQTQIKPSQLDYVIPSPAETFGWGINTMPFMNHNSPVRITMTMKQMKHALPLKYREAPLVQSIMTYRDPGDVLASSEKTQPAGIYGSAVSAIYNQFNTKVPSWVPRGAVIKHVGKNTITITDGKTDWEVDYYRDFPLNSDVIMTSAPIVKVGDKVVPGQVLTENNFSKDGVMATGLNLRIAYMPWKGLNYNDGLVVSESAAEKLTSEHVHQIESMLNPGEYISKSKFVAHYPNIYKQEQLSKLDEDGVIKEGEYVDMDDPLILKLSPRKLTEDDIVKGNISSVFKNPLSRDDTASDLDVRGVVTRVIKQPGFVKVYVSTSEPAIKGDKLCFTPDHDILTERGWVPVGELLPNDVVYSLNPDTDHIELVGIESLNSYICEDESIYDLETTQISMAVTLNHKLYAKKRYDREYKLIPAKELYTKRYRLKCNGVWAPRKPKKIEDYNLVFDGHDAVIISGNKYEDRDRSTDDYNLTLDGFLTILGMYLSEGSHSASNGTYYINISQIKPLGTRLMLDALDSLRIKYTLTSEGIRIYNKNLYTYMSRFGKCYEKFIPQWIFSLPKDKLLILYRWLMWGDGHKNICYTTTSKQLADDVQRLTLLLGMAGRLVKRNGTIGNIKGREYAFRDCYNVRIINNKLRPEINHGHTKRQDGQKECIAKYTGPVYCPTLLKNHVMYVRRNGKCHWSGNSGLHGQKGVITSILKDDEMPRDKDGNIVEIIQNPAAVPSRMNIGQIMETVASKIAKKTGKPYYVNNFENNITPEILQQELDKNGISDTETLYDKDGKPIGDVLYGYQYFNKMRQQASKYMRARGREGSYDIISRRPHEGPKVGSLGFYALLAHGIPKNLKEIATIKSERNDEWWNAFELGHPTPKPKTSFAFNKLVNFMRAAGINPRVDDGDSLRLTPMTDVDVDNLSDREIPDPGVGVRIGDPSSIEFLQPMQGGLYDRTYTGGLTGEKWSKINLGAPIPNPMFEPAIKSLLDITSDQFNNLLYGKLGVVDNKIVKVNKDNRAVAKVGGAAFTELLSAIDRDRELSDLIDRAQHSRGDIRSKLYQKIRYLNGLKKADLQPKDYIITKIGVLPPVFRPVYQTERGDLRVSDLTTLYQDVGRINNSIKDSAGLPGGLRGKLRTDLYDAVAALQGVGDASNYSNRQPLGVLKFLKGESASHGHFRDKIFGKRQSVGGRAVIMVDPKLSVDQVGMPEDMLWPMYKSFVLRRLTQSGIPALDAKKMIDTKHPRASMALDLELQKRPVLLTRDPILHKFNTMAFMAKRVNDTAIHLAPLVCKGFNADFDGDAMSVTVPVTEDAVAEATSRMLPSQNLIKYGKDTVIMKPEEDTVAGLYAGTIIKKHTGQTMDSIDDVMSAYRQGTIDLTDGVTVGVQDVSPGRIMFNYMLPEDVRDLSTPWNGKKVADTLKTIAVKHPTQYAPIVQNIKDLGDFYGTKLALSFRLRDFFTPDVSKEIQKITPNGIIPAQIEDTLNVKTRQAAPEGSVMQLLADSGAKGSWKQLRQILASPVFVDDIGGGKVPHVIKTGYARGLDYPDYWNAVKGARSSIYSSQMEVRDPGYFTKQLIRAIMGNTVVPGDGDNEGITYDISHPTVVNRFLAQDLKAPNGSLLAKRNDVLTPELINSAQRYGIKEVNVRSPLTTTAQAGFYAKDFGLMPEGSLPEVGTDLGVIASHPLTETATQTMLRAFHSAGASNQGGKVVEKDFFSLWKILNNATPAGTRAMLSPANATVNQIVPLKSGVKEIYLSDGTVVAATPQLGLRIKPGDKVVRGQQLQDGIAEPGDVLKYRGLKDLQKYLVEQVEDSYGDAAPDRRYIETLISALTRYSIVTSPDEDEAFLPGDILTTAKLQEYNKKLAAGEKKVEFDPVFVGLDQFTTKVDPDWVSQMMGRDMIRQIQQSAAIGATSTTRGANPVMPFIYGLNFGDRLDEEGIY